MRAFCIVLLLALTISACLAEAPIRSQRLRQQQLRRRPVNRFQRLQVAPVRTRTFARQQEAAPTPYPSAEELKPVNQPELVYGPPEQVYGPPVEQLPAAGAAQEFAPNPDAEEFAPVPPPTPARLSSIQPRRRPVLPQQRFEKLQTLETLQPQTPLARTVVNTAASALPATTFTVAAPLAVEPAPQPLTLPVTFNGQTVAAPQVLPTQQYYVVNQPFAYTAQFQAW